MLIYLVKDFNELFIITLYSLHEFTVTKFVFDSLIMDKRKHNGAATLICIKRSKNKKNGFTGLSATFDYVHVLENSLCTSAAIYGCFRGTRNQMCGQVWDLNVGKTSLGCQCCVTKKQCINRHEKARTVN